MEQAFLKEEPPKKTIKESPNHPCANAQEAYMKTPNSVRYISDETRPLFVGVNLQGFSSFARFKSLSQVGSSLLSVTNGGSFSDVREYYVIAPPGA